jgi:hypothetical protein
MKNSTSDQETLEQHNDYEGNKKERVETKAIDQQQRMEDPTSGS